MTHHRKLIGVLSYLVSAGLLVWLLSRVDIDRILEVIGHADWAYLALSAVLVVCASPCLAAFRWLGVLRAQQNIRIDYWVALRATMLANVLNSFLPSKGGDLAKSLFLRRQVGLSFGVGTVILERMVDLFVLGLLALLGHAFSGLRWSLLAGGVLLVCVPLALALFLLIPLNIWTYFGNRWVDKLYIIAEDVRHVFRNWVASPSAVALTFFGSLGVWALSSMAVYVLISAMGIDLKFGYAISILPLAILAGLVPVSISGIGTRDAAFVVLLDSYVPSEEATLIGIGYTFLAYWFIAIVALPFVATDILRYIRSPKST